MRLRNLRRLEEMEIRAERDALIAERAGLAALLADEGAAVGPDRRGAARGAQGLRQGRARRRAAHQLRRRARGRGGRLRGDDRARADHRRLLGDGLDPGDAAATSTPGAELKFKDGDGPRFLLHAETTDRLLLFASNGRMYTLACAGLPGGRGMGEPVRLMLDLPNEAQMLALFVHVPGGRLLVASDAGDGFVLPEDEAVAQTRAGRQMLNLKEGVRARGLPAGRTATTSRWSATTASSWSSRWPSCPRWAAARGCGCSATRTATAARRRAELRPRRRARAGRTRPAAPAPSPSSPTGSGARASAGRMAPRGFPASNRFD